MIDTTTADAYLAPRYGEDWTGLDMPVKVALLLQAADYILASYTFNIDAPEEHDAFRAAKFYLAFQLSKTPLNVAHSDAIASKEERLEGVVTEKTSYAVTTSADPYPLVTKFLKPITVQTGGFMVVGLCK